MVRKFVFEEDGVGEGVAGCGGVLGCDLFWILCGNAMLWPYFYGSGAVCVVVGWWCVWNCGFWVGWGKDRSWWAVGVQLFCGWGYGAAGWVLAIGNTSV